MQNLHKDLENLLQADQSLISDDKILKNAVIERAAKMDGGLLKLLMQSEPIRRHFFSEVEGILIFDKVKFQDFVANKAFLPDSYTAFKNRIGLTDGKTYLKESRDVVLVWPYKDCVLEGGQTKEDQGRQEVFWNTTLAPDDISRLFEPKVLTGFERWDATAVAAGKPSRVERIGDDDNLLIKGNNLLALHSLKARLAGQVKLIYIDPPFNTESDTFRYNDSFNHASWLTYMKNRLEVAWTLLRNDGTIMIHIDEKELSHLKCLCDDIFSRENFLNIFSVKTSDPSGHKTVNPSPYSQTEFVLLYARDKQNYTYDIQYVSAEYDEGYNRFISNIHDHYSEWNVVGLPEHVAQLNGYKNTREANQKLGRAVFAGLVADFAFENREAVYQATAISNDAAKVIVAARDKSKQIADQTICVEGNGSNIYIRGGRQIYFYENKVKEIDGALVPAKPLTNLWTDIPYNGISKEGGVTLKNGKKPEKLLRRIIDISTEKGELVLDFFAGSGTTAAVAHKTGRRWIAIEQLEYTEELPMNRLKNVIAGEQTGVSKIVGWQGGGAFVFSELYEWNARLADDIRDAPDAAGLQDLRDRLRVTGYVRPGVELDAMSDANFAALGLDDQKRVLMDCLELNHLYVNYGDIADEAYGVSDEDMRVNRAFYGGEA